MVIDTSAILAVLLNEAEAERFAEAIASDPHRLVSAVSHLEAGIVIRTRKGPTGVRELDQLIETAGPEDLRCHPVRGPRSAWHHGGGRGRVEPPARASGTGWSVWVSVGKQRVSGES